MDISKPNKALTPFELDRILVTIPTLLSLFGESSKMAADVILEWTASDPTEVQDLQRLLFDMVRTNRNPSMKELRIIFIGHEPHIWIEVIRNILDKSWLVATCRRRASLLIPLCRELCKRKRENEILILLRRYTVSFPPLIVRLLADLCAFLNSTTKFIEDMAVLVGPLIFLPIAGQTHTTREQEADQISSVITYMELLIWHEREIFKHLKQSVARDKIPNIPHTTGLPETRKDKSTKSQKMLTRLLPSSRNQQKETEPQRVFFAKDIFALPKSKLSYSQQIGDACDPFERRLRKQKALLRVFFQWRDPVCINCVDYLFRKFSFKDIAQALQFRYYSLPPLWIETLEQTLDPDKQENLWFSLSRNNSRFTCFECSRKANTIVTILSLQEKQSRVLDEILRGEAEYIDAMSATLNVYVDSLKRIIESDKHRATKALGLKRRHVDRIFGDRFTELIRIEQDLISRLKCLKAGHIPELGSECRVECIAQVFLKLVEQKSVFSRYAETHKSCIALLQKADSKLRRSSRVSLKRIGSMLSVPASKNFMELWFEATEVNESLQKKTLESILLMPFQKMAQSLILMRKLLDVTCSESESHESLKNACRALEAVTLRMNEELCSLDSETEVCDHPIPMNLDTCELWNSNKDLRLTAIKV